MKFVSRQEAISRKLSRYFTGKACRSGHIAERYTVSSSCVECVHPKLNRVDKSQLIRKRFRVYDDHLEIFKSALFAAAIVREPRITLQELESREQPKQMAPGRYIRAFRIFPEDESMLRELERSLEIKPQTQEQPAASQWPKGDPR